ncbi:MAG: phytoene desaturase family protein [Sphaerochaetaceae bacterium]
MNYDIVVVGGGIAGLTAASYGVRAGRTVLVCEKQSYPGGNVNSFERHGFTYDQGIRSIENSGIVFPMLRQLGIQLEFIKSPVSLGVEDRMIKIDSPHSLSDYEHLLASLFPENIADIAAIIGEIRKIMAYMDVLYGIDNPLFLDSYQDAGYLFSTLLPWLFKYQRSIPKIARLNRPVQAYLQGFTKNQALIDIIAQHFFKETPTFFALSYFSLYLDYNYPKGGTAIIPRALTNYIAARNGIIRTDTAITHVDIYNHTLSDQEGKTYSYGQLIWAADLKLLYQCLQYDRIAGEKLKKKLLDRKTELADKKGGDSIFTLYLAADLPISYFKTFSSAHLFYTPHASGLSHIPAEGLRAVLVKGGTLACADDRQVVREWLRQYFAYTTYEISFPAMRDTTLAPPDKTGLMVSTLFDYSIARYAEQTGWYDEFKLFCEGAMITVLSETLYSGLRSKVIDRFSSTPLTIERLTGNCDGAITGWAFTNPSMPVIHDMRHVRESVVTPIPDVSQAGQWVFSPSGLPISVLTGKLAAERALKALRKQRG